jgi:hypothetical protein
MRLSSNCSTQLSQERVIYNKEVQTTEVATEPIVSPTVEVSQQRISREQQEAEKAAARDKELEEETIQLEKEIEDEIRGEIHPPKFWTSLISALSERRAYRGRACQHIRCTGIH